VRSVFPIKNIAYMALSIVGDTAWLQSPISVYGFMAAFNSIINIVCIRNMCNLLYGLLIDSMVVTVQR
jgi:hypothetical protein